VFSEVFLLFGSNVGDRYAAIELGFRALEGRGLLWEAVSSYYETEPTDYEAQPWFINLVARGRTSHSPHALLDVCQNVEKAVGRVSAPRFSPRILDVDILLYGEQRMDDADLMIPHPRMTQRRFALVPLLEIAPEAVDPRDGRRFADILDGLDEEKKVAKSKTRVFSFQ
jgi:2-amino-4-hydroxy-6-hydroxymethyldihydropteridine diphosphokinase